MVSIILVLLVLGFIAWLVMGYAPIAAPFKQMILFVLVLFAALYLLQSFGLLHGAPRVRW